ncbi:hypothetical protein [[Eubacterium] cellulosolvens]
MLYDILRVAPKVELLYKLRGSRTGRRRLLPQRIGYSGRTGAYKNLRRSLIREGILNKEGAFIESGPNVWLARLSEHVQDVQVAVSIGRRVPYMIFLALVLNGSEDFKSTYRLARELKIPLRSLYAGVRSLVERKLIERQRLAVTDQKSAKQLQAWLGRYLDLTIQHANLIHDSSRMFHAVPAYIDGLEAFQRVKYEAGMPIGPTSMVIRTYEPYRSFWMRVLAEVDDFRQRSRAVSLGATRPDTGITWISGLPYASKPKHD